MDVVIFGLGPFASTIWYLLTHDSAYRVVGFTADRAYCTVDSLHDLPVVPFDALEARFPPSQVRLQLAVGPHKINGVRADLYHAAKQRGYGFASYVSSRATVWPDLRIGENHMLFEGATVQPFAVIGDNCFLTGRSHVSHHATLAIIVSFPHIQSSPAARRLASGAFSDPTAPYATASMSRRDALSGRVPS